MTMMADWTGNNIPEVVMDDASSWLAILDSERCNMADRVAFAQWLDEDPSHRWAFEELSEVWARLRTLKEVEPLLEQPDVVPFPSVSMSQIPVSTERNPAVKSDWSTLVVALLIGIGTLTHFALSSPRQEIMTGVGESRDIKLSDGSTLELNAKTSMRVSIDNQERRIELIDGEAVFHVAKDSRPFVVATEFGDVGRARHQFQYRDQRWRAGSVSNRRAGVGHDRWRAGTVNRLRRERGSSFCECRVNLGSRRVDGGDRIPSTSADLGYRGIQKAPVVAKRRGCV